MTWNVEWHNAAVKELRKLDIPIQKKILRYFRSRFVGNENPRRFGKALVGDKTGLWRYRIQGYRVICKIENDSLLVLILRVGHRNNIY
ncbi:MAG: type II toxin-antitoxin system RelE/ParE family toxin [Proteobacteria bacterium]|nr:type II toxin-antitoxin system RelE/ParE family toxin [Pseudomonadota bacterium]